MSVINFLGAAGEVTGSCYLAEVGDKKIIVDFGFFQGRSSEVYNKNKEILFSPADIDAAVITHAHLDHIGRLPLLPKFGFRGRILCTKATRELSRLILLDAAKIQEQDAAYARKHNLSYLPYEPLYNMAGVDLLEKYYTEIPIHRNSSDAVFPLGKNNIRLFDAGHILGSCAVHLELPGDNQKNIVFSGDLGRRRVPMLEDPEYINLPVDTVVMECTYGLRVHHPIDEVYNQLVAVISEAVALGSKIIVPAFSLGRTQELVYMLHLLADQGRIPRIPIIVDSPLSREIHEVYMRHYLEFDAETKRDFPNHKQPLLFPQLKFTNSVEESKSLNEMPGPLMIISASGMATGGRITHHLRNALPEAKNIVLFTGYQAAHTTGRKIIEGAKAVRILGDQVPVKASIKIINDLSAHADRDDITDYLEHCPGLKNVCLVHSEKERSVPFSQYFSARNPGIKIDIPQMGDRKEI